MSDQITTTALSDVLKLPHKNVVKLVKKLNIPLTRVGTITGEGKRQAFYILSSKLFYDTLDKLKSKPRRKLSTSQKNKMSAGLADYRKRMGYKTK